MLLYLTQAAAWINAPPPLDSVHSERLGRAPPPRLAAEEAVRLTGDEAADRMILQRLAATGSAGRAKLRRDELPVAAGRSLADLALGKTVEWKRAVNKARSDAVTAVRVRHIVVDSREMAETLSEQLRGGGARFDELARLSTCAVTRDKGGEVGWSGIEDEHLDEYFPRNLREAAMATKPGDAFLGETPLGWHVVQVVDVFQTLMIDSNPRTKGLPGTGLSPQPLIRLLRASREDARSFRQLTAGEGGGGEGGGGEGGGGEGGGGGGGEGAEASGELRRNSGRGRGAQLRYATFPRHVPPHRTDCLHRPWVAHPPPGDASATRPQGTRWTRWAAR